MNKMYISLYYVYLCSCINQDPCTKRYKIFVQFMGASSGADPGFFKRGGVHVRSTSQKRGGRRGSNFGPNVKKPT